MKIIVDNIANSLLRRPSPSSREEEEDDEDEAKKFALKLLKIYYIVV